MKIGEISARQEGKTPTQIELKSQVNQKQSVSLHYLVLFLYHEKESQLLSPGRQGRRLTTAMPLCASF